MTTDFKKIELELRRIIKTVRTGKNSLYEIAVRCVVLFNAQDDYASEIGIQPEDVAEHVNNMFLRDIAVDLSELITVLKVFPDKAQWDRPLLDLLEAAKIEIRGSRPENEGLPPSRKSVKVADYEQACADRDFFEREKKKLEERVQELESANLQLQQDTAHLQGRIVELERLVRSPALTPS